MTRTETTKTVGTCFRCGLPTSEPSRGLGNSLRVCKPCQKMDEVEA